MRSSAPTLATLALLLALVGAPQLQPHAQYTSAAAGSSALAAATTCEWARLQRCQQDALQDIQAASLNAASSQYSLTGSGPPYAPGSSSSSALASGGSYSHPLVSEASCRLVRANLDCLLQTTPVCYEAGYGLAQNTDIILRAKRFIEDNRCNAPDSTWQNTFCYRATQVKICEDNFLTQNKYSSGIISINGSVCNTYLNYHQCIERHVRLSCKVSELEMLNEYLIDKASDLAWRCPSTNTTADYKLTHYHPQTLSPIRDSYNSFSSYDQRPIPNYVGNSATRDKYAWDRFTSLDDQRYGISRFPGSGEVLGA